MLALVGRIRGEHRLAGGRIHDLLTVGIDQRLTSRYRTGGSGSACSLLRSGSRARRLIGQRARHALRRQTALTLFVDLLLTAQRGLIRIEHFGSGFNRTEIHISRHFRLVATGAQHRLQNVVHTLGEQRFHTAGVVELLAGHAQLGQFLLVGEQVALLVDHRDLALVQLRHAGRHQVDDGHDLTGLQCAPRVEFDQHRGRRLAFVTHEHRRLGHGQVYTRRLDVVEAGHRTCQLALETAAIAGRLHELAGAQALLTVENFETDTVIGRRHAGSCQAHTRTRQIVSLDQQGAGVGFDGVVDTGSGQGFDHLGSIHTVEAAIERTVIRLLRPQHNGKTDGHAGSQADQQAELTQHRHFGEIFQEAKAQQGLLRLTWLGLGRYVCYCCFSHQSTLRPASA